MIKLSVREIVEFVMRSGSIDSRYMSGSVLVDGLRAHQKIQRQRKREANEKGYEYQSERKLSHNCEYEGVHFLIEGRADGVFVDEEIFPYFHVEEIKSTTKDVETIEDSETHWSQAKFYGYMLSIVENIGNIAILLTYCSIEKPLLSTAKVFRREFSVEELEGFFFDVIAKYYKWAKMRTEYKLTRNESIKAGGFPYGEYRHGQRAFAVAVYRAIKEKRGLYIEAPTGIGKTMSSLFPTIKALGEDICEKVFYLTAKTITGKAAQDAVELLVSKGYTLRFVSLTAKDKLCPLPSRSCRPEDCKYANGHFDRINDALWAALENDHCFKRQTILDYAEEHTVCPYEMALDLSMFSDIIIGDYNYAFDPKSSLKRYFSFGGEYAFLIDEAHNLVERAREMFSAQITSEMFTNFRRLFKARGSKLYKILTEIRECIRQTGADEKTRPLNPPEPLEPLLFSFIEMADELLSEGIPDPDIGEHLMNLYFSTLDYLRVSEEFDDHYCIFTEKKGREVTLKLLCLDPSTQLRNTLNKISSATFFSATLTPLNYFKNILGGTEEDVAARLPSPFDSENLLVLIDTTVSTKYNDRERSYERIANVLLKMTSSKKGNYFAFFPSFEYAEKVFDEYMKYDLGENDTIIQTRYMNEEAREDFLSLFEPNSNGRGLLAFAVMGGVFSEGIDLIGDKLTGAAIISVGLPLVCEERDVLRQYYDKIGNGFEYAYMYPGMSKVMQAIGRVIRSNDDKGVALLIDERFTQRRYTELFPDLWGNRRLIRDIDDYALHLREFWEV